MEEVIGSIPIRSTNHLNHLAAPPFRDFVAFLSQIPKPCRAHAVDLLLCFLQPRRAFCVPHRPCPRFPCPLARRESS